MGTMTVSVFIVDVSIDGTAIRDDSDSLNLTSTACFQQTVFIFLAVSPPSNHKNTPFSSVAG